jgi:thioredoxin-like negative regulator of GroEL
MVNRKILFFTGAHCGTCKSVKSKIKARLEEKKVSNDNFKEVSIDENEGRKIAAKYSISSLPTVIIFENDRPVRTLMGSTIVQKLIADHLI